MAKYKVLKKFRDTHTKEIYEVDQEIEMTVKRASEVEKNLDSSFLVRVEEVAQAEQAKEEVTEEKAEKVK